MRIAVLYLRIIVTVALALVGPNAHSQRVTTDQDKNQLRLTTTIVKESYCSATGVRFLEWTLNLKYTNEGPEPILLDKRSSRVFRTPVSTSLKAAAAKRYVYDPYAVYASYDALGFQPRPDPDSFVILKPTESLSVEAEPRVSVYDGTNDTKDDLHAGKYFLQVTVATWRYYAEAKEYREKWVEKGYLWSKGVISDPMPFTVEKRPKLVPCTE